MNETITIDGKEYDVLDPLTTKSHNATHARIGESENVVKCEYSESELGNKGFQIDASWIYFRDMPKLGIQPLKLLPKKPVEFVGKVTDTIMGSKWIRVPSDVPLGTNLHCTQIIEGSE